MYSIILTYIVLIHFYRSGSTYGLTLEIIKVSVSKALDTLGNDDFVNVAYVSISITERVRLIFLFEQNIEIWWRFCINIFMNKCKKLP